jgi:hypothetical protein
MLKLYFKISDSLVWILHQNINFTLSVSNCLTLVSTEVEKDWMTAQWERESEGGYPWG